MSSTQDRPMRRTDPDPPIDRIDPEDPMDRMDRGSRWKGSTQPNRSTGSPRPTAHLRIDNTELADSAEAAEETLTEYRR